MSDIAPTKAFWFRIGYALERARQTVTARAELGEDGGSAARGVHSIPIPANPRLPHDERAGLHATARRTLSAATRRDPFADAAASWVERWVVARFIGAKDPGYVALGRAALAGAGAELAAVVVRAAVVGPPPVQLDTHDAPDDREGRHAGSGTQEGMGTLMEGAAEGMVYASLVRPFVPGPTWARGAAFGVARYFAARGGGLPQVLGTLSPHRRIPGLDSLVVPRTGGADSLAEHLVAGLVLAVIYESSDLSRGTNPETSD